MQTNSFGVKKKKALHKGILINQRNSSQEQQKETIVHACKHSVCRVEESIQRVNSLVNETSLVQTGSLVPKYVLVIYLFIQT